MKDNQKHEKGHFHEEPIVGDLQQDTLKRENKHRNVEDWILIFIVAFVIGGVF